MIPLLLGQLVGRYTLLIIKFQAYQKLVVTFSVYHI